MNKCASSTTSSAHLLSHIVHPAALTRRKNPKRLPRGLTGRQPRPPHSSTSAFPNPGSPSASVHSPPTPCWGPAQAHREGIRRSELGHQPWAHVLVPSERNTLPSSLFRIQKRPHTSMGFGSESDSWRGCFRSGRRVGFLVATYGLTVLPMRPCPLSSSICLEVLKLNGVLIAQSPGQGFLWRV